MISMKIKYFILFILILALSCKNNGYEEIEYYSDTEIIKERREYPDNKNDSTFYATEYYKNGKVKAEGWVLDFRSEGEWKYYYADNEFRRFIFFNYGIPEYDHPNKVIPQIILTDSLQVGKKTCMRVINLYPDQSFSCIGNVKLKRVENDLYDYELIPLEEGRISFYTEAFEAIHIDHACLNQLYKKNIITRDQKDSEYTYIYKMKQVKLGTFTVSNP